jgi:hypothetical protein
MAEQIEVQIVLDDGSVQRGFASIKKGAESAAKDVGDAFQKETTSLGKLVAGSAIGNIIAQSIIGGFTSAFRGISNLISASISEAAQSESNINRLNNALATTGQFSQVASQSLIDYASALQSTTTFSDDAILSTQSLLIQIGRLGVEEVPRATQATLDLAAALRIDLDSAARLVGKAAEGNVDAFKRYGVEIQKGATDAQTFANVLTALEQRFGGSAQREVNTFAGANAQLSNTFSDLLEELGKLITQSPTVIAFIKTISTGIASLAQTIQASLGGRDLFGSLLDGFFAVGNAILQFVVRPIELIFNVASFVFENVRTAVQVAIVAFSNLGLAVAKVLNVVGVVGDEALAGYQNFADSSLAVLQDFQSRVGETASNIGNATLTDNLSNQLVAFKDAISITRAELEALDNESQFRTENAATNTANTFLTVGSAFSNFASGFNAEAQKLRETATQAFQQVGAQALRGIGQGVGQSFAAFGRALAQGENALEAFAKAFLATIGQVAIQLGTEFILRGIAYSLDPFLAGFGPPLIAAGAALAAFGGVLSAVGGGGAGGGGGGGAGASTLTTPDQQLETFEPVEQKPQTQVAINVQGNILDRRETGLEIARIIQESFDNNDAILVRG